MLIINEVKISPKIKFKIYQKHGVEFKEIREILLDKYTPLYVQKVREDKYMAIGMGLRMLTIIFSLNEKSMNIITAYPSQDWQIKLYKRKVKK